MISVVIPVKNGAHTLEQCLISLRNQTVADTEIIVLDSGSTDNSRLIALEHGATVIDIDPETFNHGLTRNRGIAHAKGDLVFFTVQDAYLAEPDMLERMAAYFNNETIKGVVGHQAVPHDLDKNPLLWFRRYTEPVTVVRRIDDIKQFENVSPQDKQSFIAWDNVVAMYSIDALMELPFAEADFAEDWLWSYQALLKGWTLLYDPSLIVYHYHHQSYRYSYKVAYTVSYHMYKFFRFKPSLPSLFVPMLKAIYHLLKHSSLSLNEKIYWIVYNFKSRMGAFAAHADFLLRLHFGGQQAIEGRYRKVCKVVPQGKQNI